MTSPVFPTLGATTVVRKWIFEVDTANSVLSPNWVMIGGTTNTQFIPDAANFEDDSDMQSGGAGSQTKTAGSASATFTIRRAVDAATGLIYDVGQEFLRVKGINKYGPDNSVRLRISEFTPGGGPRVEAYIGRFGVGWEPQGGGNTSLDTVTVSLMGQGACAAITHPYPIVPAGPVITSVTTPMAANTAGAICRIVGSGFTGATSVKFGAGVNAVQFDVESDSLIVASAPSTAAGTVNVSVTTPVGVSATKPVVFA